jgi:Ca-activated chloride channel family protein
VLGLIVIALSRPAVKEGVQESRVEAKDIIIALDVSYSMRAKDIAPTRYAYAKKTIETFVEENAKDNIMLIAFTSNPLLLSPPTTDHVLIATALKSLNPEYILTKGTSLKKLFSKISSLKSTDKTLILMTDGGEGEDVQALSQQLKNAHVNLIVLALGTKQGSTIEKPDGTLLKDEKDHLVVTRLHPMLKTLVSQMDGSYIKASSSPEATAKDLQSALDEEAQSAQKVSKKQQHYSELYQIPLLLALLLFLMVHTRAVKYLLPIFVLMGTNAQASIMDGVHLNAAYKSYHAKDFSKTKKLLKKIDIPSLQSQVALADTYYKLGQYKKAIAIYRSIHSTSPKIKQELYYNSGNAYVMLGEYDKARKYYTKALQLGEDEESLYNLELVALLEKKNAAQLGIAHPKSQNAAASKSEKQESDKETKESRDEDQPSSGSGSGGESQKEKQNDKKKKRLMMDNKEEEQPLSSKVYELINKGYIRETQPW